MIDVIEVSHPKTEPATRAPLRRGNGKLLCGGTVVALFVFAAVFAPLITTGDPAAQDLLHRLAPPSTQHLLGTDQLGRDVWTRLVYAIRVDLRIGLLGAVIPAIIGSIIALVAGFGGKVVDTIIMRICDVVVSFPLLVFFIALVGLLGPGQGWLFLGPGEVPIIIGFTAISWIVYTRLLRTEIRRVQDTDYVRAAVTGGLPRRRVILNHLLPNAIGQTIVYVVVDIGLAIVAIATLSFLGVGIPIDVPEWGAMINSSRGLIQTNWWLMAAPGVAIATLAMGLALIGDGLDDRIKS